MFRVWRNEWRLICVDFQRFVERQNPQVVHHFEVRSMIALLPYDICKKINGNKQELGYTGTLFRPLARRPRGAKSGGSQLHRRRRSVPVGLTPPYPYLDRYRSDVSQADLLTDV